MREYWVAKVGDIPEGDSIAVRAGSRIIAVFRIDGNFYAILNRCLHKGASLCEGTVDRDRKVVVCPWHRWAWSLETGHFEVDARKGMPTYNVHVVEDEVYLQLKQ